MLSMSELAVHEFIMSKFYLMVLMVSFLSTFICQDVFPRSRPTYRSQVSSTIICPPRNDFYAISYKCGVSCAANEECISGEMCLCDGFCGLSCLPTGGWPICPLLQHPVNGNIELVLPEENEYGVHVIFSCDNTYIMVPGQSKLTCMSGNGWSGEAPRCLAEDTLPYVCDKSLLNKSEHDIVKLVGENVGYVSVNTRVKYECSEGYYFITEDYYATCLADGTWLFPQNACWKVSCASPDVPETGILEVDDFFYGSIINIHCKAGYIISEPYTAICQSNGQWDTETLPTCS
ncbi:protein lev-9-like, partial [Saccoglossus kowalevskii]|uniref:Sushi, von Willebrand factor type A, EGF and pentraxin domain-containing protein 1-like n=1 Tax=Saccoglossus kowalevskii TaxID=10224 RepID=A0ABM0MSE5_SACKO